MKTIATSVGVIAMGASFAQAADEAFSSADAGKPWNVTATLREFYDNNVSSIPNSQVGKVGTAGFWITPGGSFNWQRDTTTISLSYQYSLLYYDKRPPFSAQNYDQDHTFNALLTHVINERYKFRVSDQFVIGQEPDALRSGDALVTTQRIPGDNTRNSASLVFDAELTPIFGLEVGYDNSVFNYQAHGATILPNLVVLPSNAGSLDRVEQSVHLDGRWTVNPVTTGIVGYQYSQSDFTGNELVAINPLTSAQYFSNTRNNRSHYGYVGVEHVFTPDLSASGKVGVRYTDSYNDPTKPTTVNPFVNLSANYTYAPESYVQGGFSYDRNATSTIGSYSSTQGLTQGQQSATLFATVQHRIIPNLYAKVNASFQDATYIGGYYDSKADQYFLLSLNLRYQFSRFFSAELGMDYDNINSVAGFSYDRNKVYAGITGTY